ncbi:MAG: 50S ribosomal protein L21 [Alphaproteobacteria bacterium]|nr:50S ribosomal protein L21 [Alphaproteobacteria bacterium]
MYAVVKTGGKQYRVAKDDKIIVDRLIGEAGDSIVLDQVIMLADGDKVSVGAPTVEGAAVGATVLRQTRGPKIMVFRRKRRKNFRRVRGHRQDLTLIQINDIAADGKLKPAAKAAAPAKAKAEAAPAAAKKAAKKAAPKAEAKAAPKKAAAKATAKKTAAKKAAAKKS